MAQKFFLFTDCPLPRKPSSNLEELEEDEEDEEEEEELWMYTFENEEQLKMRLASLVKAYPRTKFRVVHGQEVKYRAEVVVNLVEWEKG